MSLAAQHPGEFADAGRSDDHPRLMAILAADVEGFTHVVERGGLAAADRLTELRRVLREAVAAAGGHLFSIAGDGFFAEFGSALDAVRCALAIQSGGAIPAGLRLRMGVTVGDVVARGEARYGTAINIAARIQAECAAGEVCLTRPVHEAVAAHLDMRADDLGLRRLKNIHRPVELVRVRPTDPAPRPTPSPTAPTALPPTATAVAEGMLLVVPFDEIGLDPAFAGIGEHLAEELVAEFSRYRQSPVLSTHAFRGYERTRTDAVPFARAVGARYILAGTIRRRESRLDLALTLAAADTGEVLWSGRLASAVRRPAAIRERLVPECVAAAERAITRAETARATARPADELSFRQLYLLGVHHRRQNTLAANDRAIRYLTAALDRQPESAAALAHLAGCYSVRNDQGWGALTPVEVERTLAWSGEAVAADPEDLTALTISGHTLAGLGGDPDGGLWRIERAAQLAPSFEEAWSRSSMVRLYAGDLKAAERRARTALRLASPERAFMPLCALGYAFLFSGEYDKAAATARRVLTGILRPPMAYFILLAAAHHSGRPDVVAAAKAGLLRVAPGFSLDAWRRNNCFAVDQHRAKLEDAFVENQVG